MIAYSHVAYYTHESAVSGYLSVLCSAATLDVVKLHPNAACALLGRMSWPDAKGSNGEPRRYRD